jgi:hypothetical protein
LEFYKNSAEINKNQYYFSFLKKKNKTGNSGRFPFSFRSLGPARRVAQPCAAALALAHPRPTRARSLSLSA